MLPAGIRRFFRLGRRHELEAELDDELAFHFEQKIAGLVAGGLSPEAARREAERQFGDMRAARGDMLRSDLGDAATRERRGWLADWRLDVRHALRSLRRTPGMTATVVVLLALGIGVNAAMLGILDRLLLRPPPHLVDPDHLVRVGVVGRIYGGGEYTRVVGSYLDVGDYARGIPELSSVAGYMPARPAKLGADSASAAKWTVATSAFFRTLGTPASLGRVFDSTDAGGPPVAVVAHDFWRSRLGGDSTALGRSIGLDGVTYQVIGVMPRGFSGAEVDASDAWTMTAHGGFEPIWLTERRMLGFQIIARLRTGADPVAAAGRIAAVREEAGSAQRGKREIGRLVSIVPGRSLVSRSPGVRLSLTVAAVALLLLLITVANVAHVLLVRAMARQREFAVRSALGAGWGRLLRLVLAESVIIALVGGVVAGGVGFVAGKGLRALLWPGYTWAVPPVTAFTMVFASLLALVIGVVTGVVPASLARREDALGALRTGVQQGRGWRGGVRMPLVVFQVAVSVVLMAGASLFVLSLVRIGTADHGMDLRHMVDAPVALDSGATWRQQLDEIESDLRRIPGATDVTAAWTAPFRGFGFDRVRSSVTDSGFGSQSVTVDAGFFGATGLRLLSGREFSAADRAGSERVTIVNDVLAVKAWPARSAIGQCLYSDRERDCLRVVGVVASARFIELKDEKESQFYRPLAQRGGAWGVTRGVEVYVRTDGDPERLVETVRRTVMQHGRGSHSTVASFNTLMDSDVRPWRVGVLLFCIAGVLALVLSVVGLYAVMAFAVRQRYHELGVRRALGAPSRHILGLVVTRGFVMVGIGVLMGSAAVFVAGKLIAPLLFETSTHDPVALVVPALGLLVAAAAASVLPALAAMRVNPREALQAD